MTEKVVGRYAPSPTGALHLGNLRTALLAWLHARLHNGRFLLRMDDLDAPRVVANSAEQIIKDLQWMGLDWDDDIYVQSEHLQEYQQALDTLNTQQKIYECFCSRKDIQQAASAPHGKTGVYPNTCRNLTDKQKQQKRQSKPPSWRIKVPDKIITFEDGCLGNCQQHMLNECGDFIIKRADGLFAYQLAVVMDDIAMGVTDVMRGQDLVDSTARQIFLFEQFNAKPPKFWHVPLMLDEQQQRMSKRDGSQSIQQWLDSGRSKQQLIGYLASSVGLVEFETECEANELLNSLSIDIFNKSLSY